MLSVKQQRALEALLVASSRAEAARIAGIDRTTMRTYFRKPEFVNAYKEAFAALVSDATRQAQQTFSPALSTLLEICQDPAASPMARISAARSLLEYGLKLGEYNDLSTRLDELERLAADE